MEIVKLETFYVVDIEAHIYVHLGNSMDFSW